MKKLTLIPITLTTLTPIVSMVGCSNTRNEYQLNKWLDDESIPTMLRTEKIDSLLPNTKYIANIEVKDWQKPLGQNPWFEFEIIDDNPPIVVSFIKEAKVYVNNRPLIYVQPVYDPFPLTPEKSNQYTIVEGIIGDDNYWIYGGYNSINATAKVRIVFTVSREIKNCYMSFAARTN